MIRKPQSKTARALLALVALSVAAIPTLAQERTARPATSSSGGGVFVWSGAETQGTYRFVNSNAAFNIETIKGAPYSADAVTTSSQILPDGNRINRETSSFVARDVEGRTRQELSLPTIGAWVPENEGQRQVLIHDPVERVTYTLNPEARTAHRSEVPIVVTSTGSGDTNVFVRSEEDVKLHKIDGKEHGVFVVRRIPEGVKVEGPDGKELGSKERIHVDRTRATHDVRTGEGSHEKGEHGSVQFFSSHSGAGPNVFHFNSSYELGEGRTEELGTKTMQGVLVEGSRTIRTIEAGQVGNELPIEIVSERWYSPDLQTVVMTSHYDPRFGETRFQLNNLKMGDPDPELFDVPSDYTISSERNSFRFEQRQ